MNATRIVARLFPLQPPWLGIMGLTLALLATISLAAGVQDQRVLSYAFIAWGLWLLRVDARRLYRPVEGEYSASTSVIIPVYHETSANLCLCVTSVLQNEPDEIILAVDSRDPRNIRLAQEMAAQWDRVKALVINGPGKRLALAEGIKAARGRIVVLVDSDVAWTPGVLREILKPFQDPLVGGVGTRQNVRNPDGSILRRLADWLLDIRFEHMVPIQSAYGVVSCLSGRTAAYRRALLLPVLDQLVHETFLGRPCIGGDDGRLTSLVLRAGYQTVYQSTAQVYAEFPDRLLLALKQRLRWARNSFRCYLRAFGEGWVFRRPLILPLTMLIILIGPFGLFFTWAYFLYHAFYSDLLLASFLLAWAVIGRGIRGLPHLWRQPQDWVITPIIALAYLTVFLLLKSYAFLTMNEQGWITRKGVGI